MSNTLLTIDMITREALRVAHEKLTFIGTVDRQYDDSFAKTGAKIGSSLRVRKPNQYVRRTGSRVMDAQDQTEVYDTITVATQDGVDMRFTSSELALSIDDFSVRYIEPAISVMASGIEGDFLEYCTKKVWNVAGTVDTAITTLSAPNLARAKMNQGLAPKDGQRFVQMDSVTSAGLVTGLSGLFQDSAQIKEQYREGMMGRTAMADWYENERTYAQVTGDDQAGAIDESAETNFVQGATTLHVDALGTTLYEGECFTIAGIYACHPETKQPLGHLQQFVLTATPTIGSNECDITFAPAIYTTGAKKNVCTSTGADLTWTAAGQDGAVVTFVGTASKTYAQPLMYHKEAFQFITADLPIMDDAHKCVRRQKDGLSMRVWQASDIRNDELLMRIDILYGMAALRPEWASRMIGSPNA